MADKKRVYLGQLLIHYKIITQEQLDRALEIQKKKGGMVGMILVNQGFLSEENLAKYVAIQQKANEERGFTDKPRKKPMLGELLIEAGEITPAQLKDALEYQKQSKVKIGIALLQKGYIDKTTLVGHLTKQAQNVIDQIGQSTVEAKTMVSEAEKR